MCKITDAIEIIEQDHIKLIQGLEKLGSCSVAERLDITRFLVGYLTSHCFLEEYVMEMINYPLRDEHRRAHKEMQDAYISRLREFLQGKDNDLIEFCKSLFEHHSKLDDAFLMETLNKYK